MTIQQANDMQAPDTDFLRPHQLKAAAAMHCGCILNGSVGSGKSRTALYFYFTLFHGEIGNHHFKPIGPNPPPLYIITTAKKRDDKEWEEELVPFLLDATIDSWNNIKKYQDVKRAFFIFDEDRVTGRGAWVKAFLKIAKQNIWLILSATPGDKYEDYIPVFVANGFYKNMSEFRREHLIINYYGSYPKLEGYINTGRLNRLRKKILINMDYKHETVAHDENLECEYDHEKYRDIVRNRWDPWKNEPIENAAQYCYLLRKVVNSDDSRVMKVLEIMESHPRVIIFYSYDYELDILREMCENNGIEYGEMNGHKHQPVPDGEKWAYLVNYAAGAEGWNCIKTNCIIFYSQNYSYKTMKQSAGRIDRLNTPFTDLWYYHLKSKSSIDLAISKALAEKKKFNEIIFVGDWR